MFSIVWFKSVFKCIGRASLGQNYYATQRLWWRAQHFTDFCRWFSVLLYFFQQRPHDVRVSVPFQYFQPVGLGRAASIRMFRLLNAQTRRCAPPTPAVPPITENKCMMSVPIIPGSLRVDVFQTRKKYFTSWEATILPLDHLSRKCFHKAVDGGKIHVG